MPVPIAELFVSVGADTSGATAGLNALNSQLSKIGTGATGGFNLGNLGKNLRTIGSQAKTAGADLTATLTAPLLGVGAAVFAAGTDFEHAFTEVKRTVDGLDDTQLQQLRADLLDMSKTSAGGLKTASDLAQIAAVGGQVGIAGGEIKDFTSLVARLSLVTDLPFDAIAEDVGRAINVMGVASKDFEAFGSVVTELGNKFGGTESDIFEFSRRLGGTLTALGVKPAQVEAIGAALSAAGVNPEAGGTAVNQFFVDMVNALNDTSAASKEAKQKLQNLKDTIADLSSNLEVAELRQKEFGRNTPASVVRANQIAIDKYKRELGQANTKLGDFTDTSAAGQLSISGMAKVAGVGEDAFRNLVKTDPARAFAAFVAGLKNINKTGGPSAVTKTLEELGITGDRQREVLLGLANAQQDVTSALDIADATWSTQTALQKEVDTALGDTTNKIKLLANKIDTELIAAWDKQRGVVNGVIDDLGTKLPQALKNINDSIPVLTPEQLAFFGFLTGLGPALLGLGAVAQILGSIAIAISAIGAAPVLVALGLLIGIPIAFDQIANHWETMKSVMDKIPLLAGFAFLIDFVKKHGNEIKQTFADLVTVVQTWDFNKELSAALITAGALFDAFGTFLSKFFDTVILPILERFKGWIGEHILGAMIGLLEFMKTLGITSIPGVTSDLGATIDQLKQQQTAATTGAAGGTNVDVTINNPVVTSQSLLDDMIAKAQAAMTQGLIMAERSVVIAPQPLPGQVPGTPF